jgi:DNA mismatch repair protein MutS
LQRGAASRSYGVVVAKLAGLPEPVLARARAILETLEREGHKQAAKPKAEKADQLALFAAKTGDSPVERETLATLRALDLDRLTGLEALQLLARLKQRL